MLIEVKDLKVGDEIIVPSNSNFKYLKVLSLGKPGAKTTRCSIRKDVITVPASKWGKELLKTEYKFEENSTLHNWKFNINLYYKMIWLVKRETTWP